MRLRSVTLVITLMILGHASSFAQESAFSGYIINTSGDTIKGTISYRERVRTPTSFVFMAQHSGSQSIYSAKEIRGFGHDGNDFVSAIVSIDKNSSKPSVKYTFYTDTVFLQVLTKGIPALYLYRDDLNVEHYYIAENNKFELLLFRVYHETGKDGKVMEVRLNAYRDKLKSHFRNCKKMDKEIDRALYNYNNLIKLFNTYYECTGVPVTKHGNKEKNEVRFGILGGRINTGIRVTNSNTPLGSGNTTRSNNLTGGIFLEFGLARTLKRFSLNNELIYTSYEIEGTHRSNPTAYHVETYSKLGASYLKLNTQVRYKFPVSKWTGFVNAGMSNGVAISKTNYSRADVKRNGLVESSTTGTAIASFREYEQGYIIGAGGRFRRYSLEARLEKSNGMSSVVHIGTHVTRWSVLLAVAL